MSQFIYPSIDLERPTFRLLLLEKATRPDIHCRLIEASFEEDFIMPYEALSYTWGPPVFSCTIDVGGESMKVTPNLHDALLHLRNDTDDRLLWVDAVCINQSNDSEKTHQVAQMGDIYRQAERVLVWLGPATPETNLAMESMESLTRIIPDTETHLSEEELESYWEFAIRKQPFAQPRYNIRPEARPSVVRAYCERGLTQLFSHAWFRRVWILQEVANARRVLIHCGRRAVSARTFSRVGMIEVDVKNHSRQVIDLLPGARSKCAWWNSSRDFYGTLQKFRGAQASDERDRIFALLGICKSRSGERRSLIVDYSWPLHRVIQEAISVIFFEAPRDMSRDIFFDNVDDLLGDVPNCGSMILQRAIRSSDIELVKKIYSKHRHIIRVDSNIWNCVLHSEKAIELTALLIVFRKEGPYSNPFSETFSPMADSHTEMLLRSVESDVSQNDTTAPLLRRVLEYCVSEIPPFVASDPSTHLFRPQQEQEDFARNVTLSLVTRGNEVELRITAMLVVCLRRELKVAKDQHHLRLKKGILFSTTEARENSRLFAYLSKKLSRSQKYRLHLHVDPGETQMKTLLHFGVPNMGAFEIVNETFSKLCEISTVQERVSAFEEFRTIFFSDLVRGEYNIP